MKRHSLLFLGLGPLIAVSLPAATAQLSYPPARIEKTQDTYFGTRVADPYRWLENGRSPETRAWLDGQERLVESYLKDLPQREKYRTRMRQLLEVESVSLPRREGFRLFYTRTFANRDKPVLFWSDEASSEYELLDPGKLSEESNITLGDWDPSPDGAMLAYQTKENNGDEAVLHVRNVVSGDEDPQDIIPGANYADVAWAPDSRGFYYMRLPPLGDLAKSATPSNAKIDDSKRVAYGEIRFHRLKSNPATDALIFPKTGDPSLFLSPQVSRDGRWLFVTMQNAWTSASVYFRPEKDAKAPFIPLFVSTSAMASVDSWGDDFFLLTNHQAPQFCVWRISPPYNQAAGWKPVVPERPNKTITSMHLIGQHLVLIVLSNAQTEMEVRDLNGVLKRRIPLPAIGRISGVSGRVDANEAFYEFESFMIPRQVYRLTVGSGPSVLWAQSVVTVHPERYAMEQVWYDSKDGTKVSMFVVQRRDAPKNGTTPFLLQGYGGFSEPVLPQFNAMTYAWLEAGGGAAFPNLRGGGEYGENWHRAGMLTRKQNTFDDFYAAADYLVKNRYTRPERLAIQGNSNGGLLAAVAITQRPELFRVAVLKSPLCDMLRYARVGAGVTWISEYGSTENAEQFRALYAYSPYHHVGIDKMYPSVLIISADNDDRVDPMHARKFAAALQAVRQKPHPILFRPQWHAGHSGAGLKSALIDDFADRLTFLTNELGL
jgi:prolyl oligopeptidase